MLHNSCFRCLCMYYYGILVKVMCVFISLLQVIHFPYKITLSGRCTVSHVVECNGH
jgi:hypothetical protein